MPLIHTELLHDLERLGGDDCRLASAARGAPVKPVPAALGVRHAALSWQQHDEALLVGELRDARASSECFGILPAAVEPDDKGWPLNLLELARQVEQVLAPRGRRREADEAMQTRFTPQ